MARHEPDIELYLAEIARFKLLTAEQECALALDISQKLVAEHEMVRCNLRLVLAIARKHQDAARAAGIPFRHLLNKGIDGLWTALKSSEPIPEARFSVVASPKITDSIASLVQHKVSEEKERTPDYKDKEHLIEKLLCGPTPEKVAESYKLLTAEEEQTLLRDILAGTKSTEQMTRRNLRLVVAIARKYLDRGLSFMDLIEEGNLGLIKAVERFSTDQGCKFSTYASWWIKQSIRRALINKVRNVRVPAYMIELMTRYRREAARMSQELKRDVAPDEVAAAMGLKPGKLQPLLQALNANTLSTASHDDDDMDSLAELPEKERQDDPESLMERYGANTLYDAMYHHLDAREQQILWMRYGLDGKETSNWTLEQIGEAVGLTRERVRQIEARALVKLRSLINLRTDDNNEPTESSASRQAIMQSLQGKLTDSVVKSLQEKRPAGSRPSRVRANQKTVSMPAEPPAAAAPEGPRAAPATGESEDAPPQA